MIVEDVKVIECLESESCERRLVDMNDGQQQTLYISPKAADLLVSSCQQFTLEMLDVESSTSWQSAGVAYALAYG
jgi:hypothetical protein